MQPHKVTRTYSLKMVPSGIVLYLCNKFLFMVVKIQFRINIIMHHKFNNSLCKWVHRPLLPHKEFCPKELYKILHKCKHFNNLL